MKKTSKKLLSLFLAVVMIITSCSIGFTAFGAEEKTDSYWSSKSDAEAAFDSLNSLVDTYLPSLLQIDAIKGILEGNLNMKVTDKTTISDVVEGASPLLLGLLGGSANKAAIRGDESPMADTYYAYLDDNSGAMDFYSLYKFCKDNAGKGGEVGKYADATLPKLQALLDAFQKANEEFGIGLATGQELMGDGGAINRCIYADATINEVYGGNLPMVPKEVFDNIDCDGTPLKDYPTDDLETFIQYMNGVLKAVDSNIEPIKTASDIAYVMMGGGQTQYIAEMFLGMAIMSGMPLEYEGIEFTMDNYLEICKDFLTMDDFIAAAMGDDSITADMLKEADPDTYAMIEASYNTVGLPMAMLQLLVDTETMDSTISPFYYQMCLGNVLYSGLFTAEDIKSMEITEAQVDQFIEYAKANFNEGEIAGQTNVDINKFIAYINSAECPFSETAKTIIRAVDKAELTKFQRFATDGKKSEVMNFNANLGAPVAEKSLIEAVNFLIPSVILNQNISSETTGFMANNVYNSFDAINKYKENVAPKTANLQFKYADYAVPGNLTVEAVNSTLNGMLDTYLTKPIEIGPVSIDVPGIIKSLIESDVELYKGNGSGALDDLWKNLHDAPIETIFKLLPVLDILVDEVVVPLVLNGDNNDAPMLDLYSILTGEGALLADYSQKEGAAKPYVGVGALNFDLNKALPAILHWITGDEDGAYDIVKKYNSTGADAEFYDTLKAYCDNGVDNEGNRLTYDGGFNSIPKFIDIYAADKAIYKFKLSSLEDTFKNGGMDNELAKGLTEAITELATFAMEAIDEYIDEHGEDARYGVDYSADIVVTQRGLNNIMVALPQVLDNMGKKFVKKYGIDSDWTYCYDGKIVETTKTFRNGTVTQLQNSTLQSFKDSGKNGADAVLGSFVNILIGNWINAILDIVNDTVADKDNVISKDLKIVDDLLNALGGFGEKSIITDLVNGFFGLTRKDDASFTLKENSKTGFNGFSNESGFFLLTNIQYNDNGTDKGIVPFIMSLVNGGKQSETPSLTSLLDNSNSKASFAPLLASKKSAAGTDYDKLLTTDNVKAANELVEKLDKVLASLLKNTSINGFALTSNDSILSGAVSFLSNYIGQNETEDLLNLIDAYVEAIVGENADGPIDASKVYTSKNLSNLVVETYSLIEAIADNLLAGIDANGLIADAICGIISPDSVGIRMNTSYSSTRNILLDGHKSWTELDGKDLKFGFSAGSKTDFYNALGESVNGIATVVGFLLTNISSKDGKNFYSELVYPVFNTIAKSVGASGVMTATEFNAATDAQKLIKGIVTPLSNILSKLYSNPATFLINLVQGLAGILEDQALLGILDGVAAPINGVIYKTIDGVVDLVDNLSPSLALFLDSTIDKALAGASIKINEKDVKLLPLNLKAIIETALGKKLSEKDVIVNLINGLIPAGYVTLPSIDWNKLNQAQTAGEALLLIYGYLVDTILGSEFLTSLVDSLDPSISTILKKLSAAQVLQILNDVLDVAETPTEIYWTFNHYASKLAGTFSYPKDISKADANKAVDQLDSIVNNIFPLLSDLGIDLGFDNLSGLVNANLFTNENLTALAVALYGALDGAVSSNETVADLVEGIGFDFSTKGMAKVLMDKSYGATYSSAAKTLKSTASWSKVKKLNWGFKNGSKMAQKGFVNGLAAILRPFDDIIAILTANNALNVDFKELGATLIPLLQTLSVETDLGEVGKLVIANGMLTITITGDKASTIKVDLATIATDALNALGSTKLYLGTNGYESAIVPLLEAFMIDDLKTYKQYKADIKKAKDNVLLDVLNPIIDLLNDVLANPIGTIAEILPNVAYFIDNNGITQAVGNLLAPILSTKGVLGALNKNGINVDQLIKSILGKSLGKVVTDALSDALGIKLTGVKLNLELMHLEKCNIQDIVIPIVSSLLKDKVGIKLPKLTFKKIAELGTVKTYKSAARNSKGNFTAKHVVADKGRVLIAVLRFAAEVITTNATTIKKLLLNIDAIKKNKTISNVISSIFGQLKTASKDDIVRAIFYFINEKATDAYWNYEDYIEKEYKFSYGNIDASFMAQLAEIADGSIDKIFALLKDLGVLDAESLTELVNSLLDGSVYNNNLIATIATGLYGAIEGVSLGDMGSLANLLAKTDIDFTTNGVAKVLTNKKYGKTYPGVAKAIRSAKSWKKVKASDLNFNVKDRDSFIQALCAVLRPLYGVLDVIFNDGSLNIFNLVSVPGSNGYESTLVPILEALGVTDLKTMSELKNDAKKAYDNILLDVLVPVFDWLEGVIAAPVETIGSILPSIALFIANDGLIQAIDNLLTPVSALLNAIKPIVDVNKIIKALGVDLDKTLGDLLKGAGIKANIHVDVYDLPSTLKPLIGQKKIVPLLNSVLGLIKVSGKPLGIKLPTIDWCELASHGEYKTVDSAAKNTEGKYKRETVDANVGETLLAVLRYVEKIVITNADAIADILGNIEALKNNKNILNLLTSIFDNIKKASKDEILEVIFYFLNGDPTDVYWNYKKYIEKDYSFNYRDIDAKFMARFANVLDGSVDKIFDLLDELGVAHIESLSAIVNSLLTENVYSDELVAKLATGLYGAIGNVALGDLGSLADLLAKTDIDFTTKGVAELLTNESYGQTYEKAAKEISKFKYWTVQYKDKKDKNGNVVRDKNGDPIKVVDKSKKYVNINNLDFGVKDKDSFFHALCAVLRPIYGVLDVLFNDGSLKIFDIVSIPGSNGYESTLVPILEALGVTGLKTAKELKADAAKAYDNILLDVINPVFNWLEGILASPFNSIASMLPSIGLFIANDGLIEAINNLITPVSALLNAIKPIVNVNDILDALDVDLDSILGDALKGAGIKVDLHVDIYDIPSTLKPLIGQNNIVPLINSVLGLIKVGEKPLKIKLPKIDWFELASHGTYKTVPSAAKNTEGRYDRETVDANVGETLLAVLRYVENLLITNADAIVDLLGNIDAIKNNKTLFNILKSIFNNFSKAKMDDIIKAILYFFEGKQTDSFFDYSEFTFNDKNEFTWGDLDQEFCETLPPMLDGLVSGLLEEKGGLNGLIGGLIYKDEIISKLATGLYGAIEGVNLGSIGSLNNILKLVGIDFTASNVANLLTDEAYGIKYESNAAKIKAAGSWKNVKPESLTWGVTDRDSFVNALCAVLRPIYGVLDVLVNDGLLNLYDIVSVPGSDGYTSTIVPLLEAFSCYNVKTQYQYREDMSKEYDAILKDVLNPLLDKVEDLLYAPVETLASMLPNLSLFFANDGLLQIIDNLLTPVSALLNALKPVVNVNDLLDALDVDLNALIAKAGLNLNINLDLYDLKGTLKPLIGAESVVGLLNNILGIIKISGKPLGLELPEIDWLKLAAHGDIVLNGSSVVSSTGTRIYVVADSAAQEAETLIAVLRFVIDTVNYKNNYQTIVDLVGGLIGGGEEGGITDVIGEVLGMLQGDSDEVILNLVDLLQSFAG